VTYKNFGGSDHITGAAEFCTHAGYINFNNMMIYYSQKAHKGRGYGHVTVLKF